MATPLAPENNDWMLLAELWPFANLYVQYTMRFQFHLPRSTLFVFSFLRCLLPSVTWRLFPDPVSAVLLLLPALIRSCLLVIQLLCAQCFSLWNSRPAASLLFSDFYRFDLILL